MIFVDSSVWIDYFNGKSTPQSDWLDYLLGVQTVATGELVLTVYANAALLYAKPSTS